MKIPIVAFNFSPFFHCAVHIVPALPDFVCHNIVDNISRQLENANKKISKAALFRRFPEGSSNNRKRPSGQIAVFLRRHSVELVELMTIEVRQFAEAAAAGGFADRHLPLLLKQPHRLADFQRRKRFYEVLIRRLPQIPAERFRRQTGEGRNFFRRRPGSAKSGRKYSRREFSGVFKIRRKKITQSCCSQVCSQVQSTRSPPSLIFQR